MEQSPIPLTPLLDQIMVAADNGLHLVAISMAASLPAICAAIENERGRAGGAEYKQWCRQNLSIESFSQITPEDLYSIRCGVLHQGRLDDLKHGVKRVLFVPPGSISFANCTINDAYLYGVSEFCSNLCAVVVDWYNRNSSNPTVQTNVAGIMQYHSNGLPPYVSGFPIIA